VLPELESSRTRALKLKMILTAGALPDAGRLANDAVHVGANQIDAVQVDTNESGMG
jgi:hypothetical protein